ncbi:hypothetical protein DdX_08772 [Ditylenchus destructor]|uniref:Uncharacterized protein n=1 Tax=Ditylenchus destructor TaxID=166010 RepID=A0AAD4N214_9BILA|nr:hypothetical protein DdX_08772 [Ditylenchus destructor]
MDATTKEEDIKFSDKVSSMKLFDCVHLYISSHPKKIEDSGRTLIVNFVHRAAQAFEGTCGPHAAVACGCHQQPAFKRSGQRNVVRVHLL